MKTGVCKNHQKEPVVIYGKCIGCEIEYYQSKISDRDKTINELREQIYGELEVSEQVVQEREELILENEELRKALKNAISKLDVVVFMIPFWTDGSKKHSDLIEKELVDIRQALKAGETK